MHIVTYSFDLGVLRAWQQGGNLVVCNNIATNVTAAGVVCGEFGCLASWP
jgi:hypothetical protein